MAATMLSCTDEDYSLSQSHKLIFSRDTVVLDTVFSNVPSVTRDFWVFNKTGHHLRLASVSQVRGNQSGFRVNVDGVFLGQTSGFQTSQVEVRAGDSIRVFVELTAMTNGQREPQKIEDKIRFTLESGAVQEIPLRAYSWDAVIMQNPVIESSTTYTPEKPIVIYGSLEVAPAATLTLAPVTTLYLRVEARINVHGTLRAMGEPGNDVVLRGYRLDNMFDYLPYDRVSGQWGGVRFHEDSYGNRMEYTDLHSAFTGIEIDSCDVSRPTLVMNNSTVHNCQGWCVKSSNANVEINNCLLSNSLNDCLFVDGGMVKVKNSTLAQFYPYDAARGVALKYSSSQTALSLSCRNSLITGYADMETLLCDTVEAYSYEFADCIIRTPKDEFPDTLRCLNVLFETSEDTLANGKEHFMKVDIDSLRYDFRLDSLSPAIDRANPLTALKIDRLGLQRDDKPDAGAYEYIKKKEE